MWCYWEILRDRIRIEFIIGCGEFGFVKMGCVLDVINDGGWSVVVIKILKGKRKSYLSVYIIFGYLFWLLCFEF